MADSVKISCINKSDRTDPHERIGMSVAIPMDHVET